LVCLAACSCLRGVRSRIKRFQEVWGLPTENITRIHNTTGEVKKALKPHEDILLSTSKGLGLTD